MDVLAIGRDTAFSPRCETRDAAILASVAARLRAAGHRVRLTDEAAFASMADGDVPATVLTMGRRLATLMRLERLERAGLRCVNTARSVMQAACSRETVMDLLQASGVPVPAYWAYDAGDYRRFGSDAALASLLPAWVKGTTGRGARPDDVRYAGTAAEADAAVEEMVARRVPDIVVTRHVEGDLVKAYAVVARGETECRWMDWFYPQEAGYTKFGAERHNSPLRHLPIDTAALRRLTADVARATGLEVLGIDVIAGADGSLSVIDVNDWPSFSVCREAAAGAIATLI